MKRSIFIFTLLLLTVSDSILFAADPKKPQKFVDFAVDKILEIPCNQANHVQLLSPLSTKVFDKHSYGRQLKFARYYQAPVDFKELEKGKREAWADLAWTHVGYHFMDAAAEGLVDRAAHIPAIPLIAGGMHYKDREFVRDNAQALLAAGGIAVMRRAINGENFTREHAKIFGKNAGVHITSEIGKEYIVYPLVAKAIPHNGTGRQVGNAIGELVMAKIAVELVNVAVRSFE